MNAVKMILLVIGLIAVPAIGLAADYDWAEGSDTLLDGATWENYNRGGRLAWENELGDWRDAAGTPQGPQPFAVAEIDDTDTPRYIEWNVTALVQAWVDGTYPNQGFFLHALQGAGPMNFRSREYGEPAQHPELVVTTTVGTRRLAPAADTYLHTTTRYSLGHTDRLSLNPDESNILLRFDLGDFSHGEAITAATLRMFTYQQYGNATLTAGVFRCAQGDTRPPGDPVGGLATDYPDDAGIADHADVIFATGFEATDWQAEWTHTRGEIDTIDSDDARRFSPLLAKALRTRIPEGENSSMSVAYKFEDMIGEEPEEIYFRYYLRFADDWNQTVDGGKLPGISSTYGLAGWGGRKPDGTDGWSARGTFYLSIAGDNPLAGTHPIGTYCYYADQPGTYGDSWPWNKSYKGFLRKNRWYCIEQYVKMNTPGEHDGILRAWVDGQQAFEKDDIMYRTVDRLKIEQIWMNVYHGGTAVSPYDQHLYIDNVVVARQYIGPMNATNPPQPGPPDPGGDDPPGSSPSAGNSGGGCFIYSMRATAGI